MIFRNIAAVAMIIALAPACKGAAGTSTGNGEAAARAAAPAQDESKLIALAIKTAAKTHQFRVEVATTPDEQARGLMFRESLPPFGGMLFPFPTPRPASFWMKNTVIPLDIIFVRKDGTIARIAAETVPYSLDEVDSGEPVSAVLELAGGRAAQLGIKEDDKVSW